MRGTMRGTGYEEDKIVEELAKLMEKAWSDEGEDVTLEDLTRRAGINGSWIPRSLLRVSARVAIARMARDPELKSKVRRASLRVLSRINAELR